MIDFKVMWATLSNNSTISAEEYAKTVGEESTKTFTTKFYSGFFQKYMSGQGLDIGYKGYLNRHVNPILPTAKGLTLDDYDGINLPFANQSQDYIYSSHVLEHISNRYEVIKDWFRVLKSGGFIICVVPSKLLYEKKEHLPSRFNEDHKIFFMPSNLLKEFEDALPINSYRVRHLRENDEGHNYMDPPEIHGRWLYEIELVLQKL